VCNGHPVIHVVDVEPDLVDEGRVGELDEEHLGAGVSSTRVDSRTLCSSSCCTCLGFWVRPMRMRKRTRVMASDRTS
jgi:hypothetical protein